MNEFLGAPGGFAAIFAMLWIGLEGISLLYRRLKHHINEHR